MAEDDTSFASRWSRRKVQARDGHALGEPVIQVVPEAAPTPPVAAPAIENPREPPPTLADVAALTQDSDFTRFVTREVTPEVKNAALKKLFNDPHFNVMDGLDTYIDDYGKPDPLPLSMLRQMNGAAFLGLFTADEAPETAAPAAVKTPSPECTTECTTARTTACTTACTTSTTAPADEDPDLQLQQQHAAGCASTQPGAGEDLAGQL